MWLRTVTVGRKRDEVKPNGKNWANLPAVVTLATGTLAAGDPRRNSYGSADPVPVPVRAGVPARGDAPTGDYL
jgi:hypothetical protein